MMTIYLSFLGLPLGVQFINDSPRVVGNNSVEAEFTTTGPVASVICSLTGGVSQECKTSTGKKKCQWTLFCVMSSACVNFVQFVQLPILVVK